MDNSGGWNRTMALFQSVRMSHEEDPRAGRAYKEAYLARRPRAGDGWYLHYLDEYLARFTEQGNVVYATQQRIALDLGSGVELAGRIERLDLVPAGGYAAWLYQVVPRPRRWQRHLRMPLIQRAVADSLGAPLHEVSVGMYWFEPAEYSAKSYADAEVRAAVEEARDLAAALTRLTT